MENFRITRYTIYHNTKAVSSKIDRATFGGLEVRRACALTCLRVGLSKTVALTLSYSAGMMCKLFHLDIRFLKGAH